MSRLSNGEMELRRRIARRGFTAILAPARSLVVQRDKVTWRWCPGRRGVGCGRHGMCGCTASLAPGRGVDGVGWLIEVRYYDRGAMIGKGDVIGGFMQEVRRTLQFWPR